MATEILSAGMAVKWAVEATAGTRPTTGYATIASVKEINEDNDAPNLIQVTDLSATYKHKYIRGLITGDTPLQFTVNDTPEFRTTWDAMFAAYETAKAAGKALWIEYAYPAGSGLDSYYYTGEPSPRGFGGATVDAVLETTAYMIQSGEPTWESASA